MFLFRIRLHYFFIKLLQIIRRMHEHNHDSNAAAIEVARVKTAIKHRAEDTVEVCMAQLLKYEYYHVMEIDCSDRRRLLLMWSRT